MFDTVKVNLKTDNSSQTIELVPSLDAVELISERFGNFNNAISSTSSFDFNAIFNIFDAGIKKPKHSAYNPKELRKAIYETGFVDLMPEAIEFLTLCMNGGKRPVDDEPEQDSKKKTE